MDSTVCALHVSYGQRTEARELRAAREAAQALAIRRFLHLHTDLFRQIGGSALTYDSIPVPQTATPGEAIPVTYVPFRNAHFLAAAVSWAEVLGARAVYVGAVEQDSSGYPDCRPAYYQAFQQLIRAGTREGDIEVKTPLIHLRKWEIVRLGVEEGAPLDVTWSCYQGADQACGACDSCVLRLQAFAEAGVEDRVPCVASATEG